MFSKKKVITLLLAVLIVFCIVLIYQSLGLYIKTINHSDLFIKKATIYYNSVSIECGQIAPGKSKNVRIRPTSETGIRAKFEFDGGKVVWTNANTYIERNYRGTLTMSVDNKFEVTVIDAITVK